MYKDILKSTSHREYTLPQGRWIMMQQWEHLLFLHWPVPKEVMEEHLPPGLEIDTYDGDAWISIIPFKVSKMCPRNMPRIPYWGSFLEVNVRTYVKRDDIRGIYFFSLDASKLLSVLGARLATLPYFYAAMSMKKIDETFYYYSSRSGKESVVFKGCFQPIGEAFYPEKDSLTYWLLERYFMWTYKNNSLYRVGIHHKKWEIQNAEVKMEKQTLTSFLPENLLDSKPIIHYASSKVALNWMARKEE